MNHDNGEQGYKNEAPELNRSIDENTPEFRPKEPVRNPLGAIIGIIAILAFFILSALYLYGKRLDSNETASKLDNLKSEETSANTDTAENTDAKGDEFDSIENELTSIDDSDTLGADLENELSTGISEE